MKEKSNDFLFCLQDKIENHESCQPISLPSAHLFQFAVHRHHSYITIF